MYFEDVEAIARTYGETLFHDATNAKIFNKNKNVTLKIYFDRKYFPWKSKNPKFYNGNPIIKVYYLYNFLKNRLFPNFLHSV